MHIDLDRRYASAAELGAELEAVLEDRPVQAQPDRWSYRARRFVSRYRLPVAAAALAASGLIVGLGLALDQRRLAVRERGWNCGAASARSFRKSPPSTTNLARGASWQVRRAVLAVASSSTARSLS